MSAAASVFVEHHAQSSAEKLASRIGPYLEAILFTEAGDLSTKQLLTGILSNYYSVDVAQNISGALFDEFGSFTGVINTSYERIEQIANLSRDFWLSLQTIKLSIALTLREGIQEQPIIDDLDAVHQYLAFTIGQESSESVRLLFLDSKNRLLRDELHSRGTTNSTMFYPKELVRRACELRAGALVVAHNHPSGDPTPSQADIDVTVHIATTLRIIGVFLHDHVIVGKRRTFSFRQAGLLK